VGDEVLVERRNGVHILTLNRPDRLNAVTVPLFAALMAALDEAATANDCRAVLLHGAGRGFCAGQDLGEVQPGADLGHTLEARFNPLVRRLRSLPKPIVCAVHGVAAGAGANLALACDIVLAAHSARFLQAFVKIGLIPDAGGTWLLPRLAGRARAAAMAMLGEPVPAVQAEAWGLIWRAVPDDELMPEAERMAAHLASQPTAALALMKQALDASEGHTLDQQLDLERDLQRRAGSTPDFEEGVRAFLEKRPPRFTGRAR
jgi:2-(1,2-epoxy-1,2-dihydrophenyl)acetyl-CoA isomerase